MEKPNNETMMGRRLPMSSDPGPGAPQDGAESEAQNVEQDAQDTDFGGDVEFV